MPAREINPFTDLTRIRSVFLRTQWSTSNHQRVDKTTPQTAKPSGWAHSLWRYYCILNIWGIQVSFGCECSCSSARILYNFNSNVPQGGIYPHIKFERDPLFESSVQFTSSESTGGCGGDAKTILSPITSFGDIIINTKINISTSFGTISLEPNSFISYAKVIFSSLWNHNVKYTHNLLNWYVDTICFLLYMPWFYMQDGHTLHCI